MSGDMTFTAFMADLTTTEYAAAILMTGVLAAGTFELLVKRFVVRLVQHTRNTLDDELLEILRHPLAGTAVLAAAIKAIVVLNPAMWFRDLCAGVLESGLILLWAHTALRLSQFVLQTVARPDGPTDFHIHPRSIPVFAFCVKLGVYTLAAYLVLAAWKIDASAVLKSVGVVGIAVGFAAQQSLANLFAGVLIIADAPYQMGDMLQLESGDRGEVIEIGIRSTRLLTTDGVEIIVPNSIMANTKVVNETGGPMRPRRVRVPIGVAYGVDIKRVKTVLTDAMKELPEVLEGPPGAPPSIVVRAFGPSSVDLDVIVWLAEARDLTTFTDAVNSAIYSALNAAEIEIPYPKQDVYLYPSDTDETAAAEAPLPTGEA